ncbi:MAG: lytic transglycosylase domain-containing protein [Cytophagales bacterium]|nr:lytic transglycosylase domain-containing protein [Bernardetiaceae bacterium]MDW8210276.1 lytic transglycosylase domain-containing protein [Cytophagales bacterium]
MKNIKGVFITITLLVVIAIAIYELKKWEFSGGYKQTEAIFNVYVPDFFEFCGEVVPLKRPEVREYFDRELHIHAYWSANNILLVRRASIWLPLISQILKQEGLPEDLKYIAVVESALTNSFSPAGAAGFWQLMPATAQAMGLEVTPQVDERLDVEKSTRAACKYLKMLYQQVGSWTNALAAYNMGAEVFSWAMKRQRKNSFYDLELGVQTTRFVYRTLALKEIMSHPEKYKIPLLPQQPLPHFTIEEVREDIPSLVQFAAARGIHYRTFRHMNEWLLSEQLKVPKGKTYRLKIPLSDSSSTHK